MLRRLGASALVLLVFLGVLVPGSPAQAYVTTVSVTPTTITDSAGGPGSIAATLRLSMRAGEARNLRAELVLGNPQADGRPNGVAAAQRIACRVAGAPYAQTDPQIWNTRNVWPADGDTTLMVRMLFIAPATATYDCDLRVYLNDNYAPGRETVAMKGGFIGDIDGALSGVAQRLRDTASPTTRYFPLGGASSQLYHLSYAPPAGTTSFRVIGDLQTTSCYGTGGNTCAQWGGPFPTAGSARVYSRVVATPSVTTGGCASVASTPKTTTVTIPTHHLRIHHEITVGQPAAGCGTWTLDLVARDDGGQLPFVANIGDPYTVVYARPS